MTRPAIRGVVESPRIALQTPLALQATTDVRPNRLRSLKNDSEISLKLLNPNSAFMRVSQRSTRREITMTTKQNIPATQVTSLGLLGHDERHAPQPPGRSR